MTRARLALLLAALAAGMLFLTPPAEPFDGRAAAGARAVQCATCHRGIEDAHPKKALACTTCRRGDASASDAQKAHAGMYANPSDLRLASGRAVPVAAIRPSPGA